ncbi:MAG: hypothetical protein LC797_20440 [Chloroflexi bacterium]|nr:hypothetical protein [Chloroflexota bacterium]
MRAATRLWLAFGAVLGGLQALYARYSMNPDGIAYLDMGDAYLRGDWAIAIRSHWSPLYALLLATGLQLTRPPPNLEFPVVHMVNFLIYGVALGAFTFLLHQIVAIAREIGAAAPTQIGLPAWAWPALGYAAFVWCTLQYTPLGLLTPDLLVSALVYAIGGVMLRMMRLPSRRYSALFGALLGLGYLAKAPMLPLAVVLLAASVLVLGGRASRLAHVMVASCSLALVALPFIGVLSVANGRPTAGDSAVLNYLWVVDGLPVVHWQGGPAGIGQPLHHSVQLLARPSVYAFDSPFPVTYAAWYAPEYWFQGATPLSCPPVPWTAAAGAPAAGGLECGPGRECQRGHRAPFAGRDWLRHRGYGRRDLRASTARSAPGTRRPGPGGPRVGRRRHSARRRGGEWQSRIQRLLGATGACPDRRGSERWRRRGDPGGRPDRAHNRPDRAAHPERAGRRGARLAGPHG